MNDDFVPPSGNYWLRSRSRALERAFRLLARRDHTHQELALKLRHKGFDRVAVAGALARCRELGYLDDAKTAMLIAGQLTGRGYGPLRVRQTLMQKGVDDALIEKALTRCGDDAAQVQNARGQLAKKASRLGREPDPWKRRQIAYRFLTGRGFPSAIVNRAITGI